MRNLTQVSRFPSVRKKIGCGATRLLESLDEEIGDRPLFESLDPLPIPLLPIPSPVVGRGSG
jgi:hypothetical protein